MSIPVNPYRRVDINEGSTAILEVTYLDKDDANITPSAVSYRVDDLTNQRQVVDWTAVAAPSTTNTITVTATENNLNSRSQEKEMRQITVNSTDSTGNVTQQIFIYTLIRIFTRVDQVI